VTFGEFLKYVLLLIFFPRSLKTMEWRMLRLLNKDRKKNGGLAPVAMQEDLREVARKHSRDMAEKDYFAHVNLKGKSPFDRLAMAGVSDVIAGENLAKIGGYPNATQRAETGLMNSPGHRANILNPAYNAVGIGVIKSQTRIYYFTQNFARRELVFKTKIRQVVRLQKGLRLEGAAFADVKTVFYQLRFPGQSQALQEKLIPIRDGHFEVTLSFPHVGLYEILLFVGLHRSGNFALANRFEVRAVKGFWATIF